MAGKRSNRARVAETASATEKIAAYKTILKEYIDRRPSGLRQKLAAALGKHKSFISQITGPSYAMPIPVAHLQTIFDICHFSPTERKNFLLLIRRTSGARNRCRTSSPAPIAQMIGNWRPVLADRDSKRQPRTAQGVAGKGFAMIHRSIKEREVLMKKLLNTADTILSESLRGFGQAHADIVAVNFEPNFVFRVNKPKGKVALVSGGGSGHEPLHAGFVGYGMLDAACPGQVFTSPTPDQINAAAEAADTGAGVLFIVKNYSGDVMNFEMAAEFFSGAQASVITNDDVAVENSTYTTGRRGVAGTLVVEKIVGAAAEAGSDLVACHALGERVNRRCGSMGVALTSCTVPAAGKPTFSLSETEMEMGVGIKEKGRGGRAGEPIRCRRVAADRRQSQTEAGEPLRLS